MDGQTDLLVDPARVRRSLSENGYSHAGLWKLLDEIMQAVVEARTPTMHGMGHLIDSVVKSKKTRRDPLTGEERALWVVRLGLAARMFDVHDLPLRHDPAPVARLATGTGQAVARHVLTHKHEPRGGWTVDGLIMAVAGDEISGQALRNRRRELLADAPGLAAAGILVEGGRVRRMGQPPDSVLQPPDSVLQPPDSVLQPPDSVLHPPDI